MMALLRSTLRNPGLVLGWLLLLIGAAWSFGALWFDLPITALRHALAVVFLCSALAAFVFVRPRWRAKLGLVVAIALIAASELLIRPCSALGG
jgi:hypothetical protein